MKHFASQKGFSLIEMIIVVAIFSGIMFVISSFILSTANFEDLINQKLQVRQDSEQAFQILVTEVRSMGPSSIGAYPIESAGTSSLIFYSDVDEDGLFEKVGYMFGTSTLSRSVIKPAGNPLAYATSSAIMTTIIEKVVTSTTPIFEYYGDGYTGTESALPDPVSPQDVRVIQVSVFADLSPRAPKPILFLNVINPRNLRSN